MKLPETTPARSVEFIDQCRGLVAAGNWSYALDELNTPDAPAHLQHFRTHHPQAWILACRFMSRVGGIRAAWLAKTAKRGRWGASCYE